MIHKGSTDKKPRNPPPEQDEVYAAKKEGPQKKRFGFLIRSAARAAVIFGGAAVCWLWVLRPVYITGNAMFPALKDGDLCIVYRAGKYYTGDLVVYKTADGDTRAGRIAACGGQEVSFPEGGGYTVDGYQPAEEILYPTYRAQEGTVVYPLTVQEDSFFIMNDFRSDEEDSRSLGCVGKEDIVGRAVFLCRRRGF